MRISDWSSDVCSSDLFLPTLLKDHGRQIAFGYGYTLHVCDLLPKSRGRIGLKSRNPLDDPLIDPAYLSAPEEIETMVWAVRIGRSEEHTSELQSLMRISYAVFCLTTKHLKTSIHE